MNRRGFTLIEVIVVTGLIGILLSIATLQFGDYLRKGAIERQAKEMYADVMATRTAAVTQRSPKGVTITPTTITFVDGGSGNSTRTLTKPVTWAGKSSGDSGMLILFDERGTFDIANDGNTAICIEPSMASARYDSIVIYPTRIQLGKVTFGGECTSANVAIK